jgi:superfamily II DNA or RNA helicase
MAWVKHSPRDVATLMLNELFAGDGGTAAPADRSFPLTDFQEVAARRAGSILERWGGVLIADSVGLGKTYVALALIEEALRTGTSVLVAVPAALRSVWRGPLRRLRARHPATPIHFVSHTQLSRGSYPSGLVGTLGLVVVDEAHRFRNPRTRRYAALAALRGHGRMALLTATPVNNSLHDLRHLLRLFAADDAFVGLGVPSLADVFDAEPDGGTGLGRVVHEVVVRRTRAMVRSLPCSDTSPRTDLRFPRRAPPRIVRFEGARVPRLAAAIAELELAPYTIAGEGSRGDSRRGDGGGEGVAALVRLGLLKRLESGSTALARSIQRQLSFSRAFRSALAAGRLLRPGWTGECRAGGDLDPLQLVLVDLVAERCPPGLDPAPLLAAAERDSERLVAMARLLAGPDLKLDALRRLLAGLASEKAVVFTEFRDTAEQLWRGLGPSFAVARIDGGGAWLGRHRAGRGAVIERFAPRANGAAEPSARERVDVLIVTDVLAEGTNLQDARHVICYDLPWNPVRLMQRIGRVDRLGSPHTEVVPHIFLPATGLEELLGLTRRLRDKLGAIARSVGDDDGGELLSRLQDGGQAAASVLARMDSRDHDPMESLRIRWHAGRQPDPRAGPSGADTESEQIPVAWLRTEGGPAPVRGLAIVRFRGRPWLVEVDATGDVREAGAAAAGLLMSALDMGREAPCPAQRPDDQARRTARDIRAYFRTIAAAAQAPRPVRSGDPAGHLARTVRRAMASPDVWAHPRLIARADRILQRLDRPLPADALLHARSLVSTRPDGITGISGFLDRMERLLRAEEPRIEGGSPGAASGNGRDEPSLTDPRIVAMMLVG